MPRTRQPRKKKRRIRCLRVKELERLYQIINRVQMKAKESNIYIEDENMLLVAENIMKDAGLEFERKRDMDRDYYHVSPGLRETTNEIDLEEFDDEDPSGEFIVDFFS